MKAYRVAVYLTVWESDEEDAAYRVIKELDVLVENHNSPVVAAVLIPDTEVKEVTPHKQKGGDSA